MSFVALYKDPKKKKLQRLEIALLLIVSPFAMVWGARTVSTWRDFRTAESLFTQGDSHLHANRPKDAIAAFEKTVVLCPQLYAAWENLGVTYHVIGEHDKELAAYRRAVIAIPDRGELFRELGTAYHEMGDHEEELKQLSRASELIGDDVFTSRLLSRAEQEVAGTYPKIATPKGQKASPTENVELSHPPGHTH